MERFWKYRSFKMGKNHSYVAFTLNEKLMSHISFSPLFFSSILTHYNNVTFLFVFLIYTFSICTFVSQQRLSVIAPNHEILWMVLFNFWFFNALHYSLKSSKLASAYSPFFGKFFNPFKLINSTTIQKNLFLRNIQKI